MADEENKVEPTETDIFEQQKQTIELLQDVIAKRDAASPQIIYSTPAAPTPAKSTPNYLMYIGVGAAVFLILLWSKK